MGMQFLLQAVARALNEFVFAAGVELPIPHTIELSNTHFLTENRYIEIGAAIDPVTYENMFKIVT
jgi:hypothetical protein